MIRPGAVLLILTLALLGCAGPGSDLPPIGDAKVTSYRLGPGDRVRIVVFGSDALSKDYVVSDSGRISMPLLGVIDANGLTAEELEAAIRQQLRAKELDADPSVSAEVLQYRPFFVLGEVRSPGSYAYVPGMTLKTAVAIAGGYTFRAEEEYAAITRTTDEAVVEGRATSRTPVLPGDTIYVYESWF